MIIVRLKGGLGNQMFQYALARKISIQNKQILKLDISTSFNSDFYKRKYRLSHMQIIENIATQEDIDKFPLRSHGYLKFGINMLKQIFKPSNIIKQASPSFDPKIINRNYINNTYFDGYWQSEKYFKGIENLIRKEYEIKSFIKEQVYKIADKIRNTNSVSLHLRLLHGISRDGNVDNKAVKYYGKISLKYINNAIELISERVNNPYIFVFSDNPEIAKNSINLSHPSFFVSENKDYEDLWLMSLCKHNIIANSTFSWWGAWLNKNPNKIVVAPKKWFADPAKNKNIKDLILKRWIKI